MLSVPDFFKGVESDNPTQDFTHHFGKMMVMYRLLGGRPGIAISTCNDENGFGFNVKAKNKHDAKSVNEFVNGISYIVYGNSYGISSTCEQKTVHIQIMKK